MDNGIVFLLIVIACSIIGFFFLCIYQGIGNLIDYKVDNDARYKQEYLLSSVKWFVLSTMDIVVGCGFVYLLNLKGLI